MTLDELEKKIKSYKCNALKDKEVCNHFVNTMAEGYIEDIVDLRYNATSQRFEFVTNNTRKSSVGTQVYIQNK